MKSYFKVVLGVLLLSGIAIAARQGLGSVDTFNSPKPQYFPKGIFVGSSSVDALASTTNKVTGILGASSTIDFSSATVGVALSSSITVTGVRAGDPCFVGVPTAAAALAAEFTCYVDAANSVKVQFVPEAEDFGSITLSGGTGTATVTSGTQCVCTDRTANASVKCAVSSTTLTATGTTTDVINYYCRAPVDPASGTFYVRVISGQ